MPSVTGTVYGTAWLVCAALAMPAVAMLATARDWPPWLFMWALAFSIYAACKLLTWLTFPVTGVPFWRQVAYLAAWPGLNARRFLTDDSANRVQPPSRAEWIAAAVTTCIGALVFWSAQEWIPASSLFVLGWAGMVGTVLMLHFGSFHLLSCLWRSYGIDAKPIMNKPTRSHSVSDFWSNRWNTAFRDFTHQFVFGPLARRWGLTAALVIGFAFSGVVHDLVISLPARGGYGGPTAFFVIQCLAILVERSRAGKVLGLGSGWRGWLFTAIVLVAPVKLLFHEQFLFAVVVPFMKALGAA